MLFPFQLFQYYPAPLRLMVKDFMLFSPAHTSASPFAIPLKARDASFAKEKGKDVDL